MTMTWSLARQHFAQEWLKLLTMELLQPDGALCAWPGKVGRGLIAPH